LLYYDAMSNIVRYLLSAGFLFAGVMHFVKPAPFLAIYPEGWPMPLAMIYLSGAAEILGAIGLLVAKTRFAAAVGLILLLVAVFPANINMAVNTDRFSQIPEWILWLRLPLQFLLIFLVWRCRRG
jgi:uncharacterized membrane protein